jgi:hypothetical protein
MFYSYRLTVLFSLVLLVVPLLASGHSAGGAEGEDELLGTTADVLDDQQDEPFQVYFLRHGTTGPPPNRGGRRLKPNRKNRARQSRVSAKSAKSSKAAPAPPAAKATPGPDVQHLCSDLAVMNDPQIKAACAGAGGMANQDLLPRLMGALTADYPEVGLIGPCTSDASSLASSSTTTATVFNFTAPMNNGPDSAGAASAGAASAGQENETGFVRVIFRCRAEEPQSECENRIRVIPEGSFSIVYYLELPHAYSLSVESSYVDSLEGVEDDPPRFPTQVESSQKIHRQLQGQHVPYGINMVKAPSVWSKYNTRGENVRVCGQCHQLYLLRLIIHSSHNILTPPPSSLRSSRRYWCEQIPS